LVGHVACMIQVGMINSANMKCRDHTGGRELVERRIAKSIQNSRI
jgi:hypothetical protein